MATTYDGHRRRRCALLAVLLAAALTPLHHSASAQDDGEQSEEKAVCLEMIDSAADQIQKYCAARRLRSLQCLDFRGSHGSLSNESLERQWIASLKEKGMQIQEQDSTRLRGRIVSQTNKDVSVVMLKCTLTDNTGAELKIFCVRRVIGG